MEEQLLEIFQRIENCEGCTLFKTRTKVVFNGVPAKKPLILLGEAPGGHEDTISGIPFSGQAGQYLTNFLEGVSIDRDKCYITNAVKCRPTKFSKRPRYGNYANRKPTAGEINSCYHFLKEEMEALGSRIIVTLGIVPFQIFSKKLQLKEVHGTPIDFEDKIVFPLYHPASVIYNGSLKEIYEEDLRKLRIFLEEHNEYL
ncbi:hypothetical protein AZF37_05385 [endosymbiont 'TC1' of Trimyema compressum]|uniref:uracil-DNA glycosylase n=1 Tax=endosymbiont 'TC1' of Trimyema compressum TaxID=243899 RepID=UPI0007F15A2A|nr:uracil-DNA glycosylase [endosymbiont 'TC1' of Trimyema compressum]AMP20686.1 hypothetical protein AZF37_05385 [endosymbiont 'TC1' of Trimyema compressum]